MKNHIQHRGIVKNITEKGVEVLIEARSACLSCQLKSSCSISDKEEKVITIAYQPDGKFHQGDQVEVVMKTSHGFQAVLLAYVMPVILILLTMITGLMMNLSENLLAFLFLGAVVLYFIGLWLFRKRLQQRFTFSLKQTVL